MTGGSSGRPRLALVATLSIRLLSLSTLIAVGITVGALAAGYRPIVILTGSMGDTAPAGSLVIAEPVQADAVTVGDVLVMRRPGSTPVTHRVVEIENADAPGATGRFAITRGDANEAVDATPYPLAGSQLVGRWAVPHVGRWLQALFEPGPVLAIVALAVAVWTFGALRRIWAPPSGGPPSTGSGPSSGSDADWERVQLRPSRLGPAEPASWARADGIASRLPPPIRARIQMRRRARRRASALAVVLAAPAVIFGTAAVAWAAFQGADTVSTNTFGTRACFDPKLTSIQSGETVHAVNGTVSVPITGVDPARSFVMASLRSSVAQPPDATVSVELDGAGTGIDLIRPTNAGTVPAITVAWSVVEYGCGVSVQRGTLTGATTSQIDIPISTVDPAASFVLVTTSPAAGDGIFSQDDLYIAELADGSTLRIRTDASPVAPARSFSWQVITFDDPADATVQTVGTTLNATEGSDTITLSTPVDPDTTFLVATAASASTGADVGERLVRAHLVNSTTVAVDRSVATESVEISVQVVDLNDGSTVRHGTVDLAATEASTTVTIDPVDPARSLAVSTVAQPGAQGGGMTDYVTSDLPGEASATFDVTNSTTITVTRDVSASNASFGWQVIEWAGPGWWDGNWDFRQRIDLVATTTAAPDGYSVPVAVDHAALVASGLARADGSDVRVLRWDGSTWIELDRVLDDDSAWNRVDTTIWFRSQAAVAANSDDTYWLYYGNGTPSSPPEDPENVYLLTETFDAGVLGDFVDQTTGTGWYVADPWTRRIPVTVPSGSVASDLTDYPLLVSLTSADLGTNALADGSDIRFTAADGSTPLAHEIERFDSATGALAAWVLVPTITAASDTTVYLYYAAPNAPDQQDIRATWPADVEAAWHLHRSPAGSAPQLDDSTINNHDGLSGGAMTVGDLVTAGATPAIDFDGGNDVLRADAFDPTPTGQLTISGFVNLDAHTASGRLVTKADNATTRIFGISFSASGDIRGRLVLDGVLTEFTAGIVPVGAWHHVALTWDGTTARLYLDGVEQGSQAATGALDRDHTMPVTIGNVVSADRGLDGRIDEVRIERVARSAAWLAALASNVRSPGAFLSVGAVETGSWLGQGTWDHRQPIGVDHVLVDADQTDYPLLVEITDAGLTGATSDGRDVVFTAADGTTRLDHAIERFDQTTGAVAAWVRVPNVSSVSDTRLFLYYGNSSADWQTDAPAVFGDASDLVLNGGRTD
ncbi:MAG: signal peptidase I [Actinomycetota bacterium]